MVLVVHAYLQFAAACANDGRRENDVAALSKENQWHLRVPDEAFPDESGHLEVCP